MKRPLLSLLLAFVFLSSSGQQFSLIKDINPGNSSSNICYLTNVDDKLFFAANDGISGMELWKSDGTEAGTSIVKDINPGISNSSIGYLTKVGHIIFFVATNGIAGAEIWKSDGTPNGTTMVKDIRGGTRGSNPSSLVCLNGQLYFSADDGIHGMELWKSDGTSAGTVMVQDINLSGPSYPSYLASLNGRLYFSATDGISGMELWISDGTSAGTDLIKDILPGADGSYPSNILSVNNEVYFSADDGVGGNELWKTDGTISATAMIKDIMPGAGSSYPGSLRNIDGNLLFTADNGSTGFELWKSDGTRSGTTLVKDIWPGPESGAAGNFSTLINRLIFTGNDGLNGYKTWQSDGSLPGTKIATGFVDPGDGAMQELVETNTNIFASIDKAGIGLELWGISYSGTLPLTFLDFNGKLEKGNAILNWTTANEFYTKDFIVERSVDGLFYEPIAKVKCETGNGNHSYQYIDQGLNKSVAITFYYRLKQNDISQKFKYSKIVTLTKNEKENSFIYVGPAMNEVTIRINNGKETRLDYALYDNAAKLLKKGDRKLLAGENILILPINTMSAGIYYLKLNSSTLNQTHRFIKK